MSIPCNKILHHGIINQQCTLAIFEQKLYPFWGIIIGDGQITTAGLEHTDNRNRHPLVPGKAKGYQLT